MHIAECTGTPLSALYSMQYYAGNSERGGCAHLTTVTLYITIFLNVSGIIRNFLADTDIKASEYFHAFHVPIPSTGSRLTMIP